TGLMNEEDLKHSPLLGSVLKRARDVATHLLGVVSREPLGEPHSEEPYQADEKPRSGKAESG
ncbi:MAG: hypothetical protein NTZ61_01850, partial [Proteobacteria bacterium]|nr:hypothetical protein [Pseudomonadota bacterium]